MTRERTFMLMVIPALLIFFAFHTFPVFQGIFYSFTNYKGYGDWDLVGFSNYFNVVQDDRAWGAYGFTFQFAIVATLAVNILSLIIARGLHAKIKFLRTLRAIYFLPFILSMIIIGYIFRFMFTNLLPQLGQSLDIGFLSTNILGNPDLAWVGIVVVTVWQSVAFHILLYLAGLSTVDQSIYEAADIDGAGSWSQFWKITFPLIAPFFTINMVVAMKNFLMAFDQVVALTNGGPGNATQSISLLIFSSGFGGGEFAYQSANAVIFFVVIVTISLLQFRVLEKREEKHI